MDTEGVLMTCTKANIGSNVTTVTMGPLKHHGGLAPAAMRVQTSEGPMKPLVHCAAVLGLVSLAGPSGVARADGRPVLTRAMLLVSICAT